MSIFSNIFEVLDPFNILGFNEEEKEEEEKNEDTSFSSLGIYPWDDDDDE